MKNNKNHNFPIRDDTHTIEHDSLVILQNQLLRGWIIRSPGEDYGIDGEIEIISKNGLVKGDIFKFQIKGHRKVKPKGQYIIQQVKVSTINYWLEISLPIILFVVNINQSVVYWIDVKEYIKDTLSIIKSDWHNQKTVQIKIPLTNSLPNGLRKIKQIVLSYKELIKSYQTYFNELEEDTIVGDFMGYHIFIHLFDGNIDAWEKYLRNKGSEEQLIQDIPFVFWLKGQLKKDKTLIKRIRKLVRKTTKYFDP